MHDIVEPNEEAADYPMESPRTEPDHCIDPPTAGVARSGPRVWFRDIGESKEPVGDQAWMDPGQSEFLRELAAQMARGVVQASQRSIGYEDGKNMRDFLDLAELDFIERGLEERLWGEELKRYLRGDALRFWLYLRRTGEPLTDWEQLRQRFCEQFCNITLERMKVMIAKNVWRGDHHAYSARFADIVAQGVTVAPDMLVGYYLANLPGEILREITRGGTRTFADWRDAAAALAAMATPWKDLCENHHRFRRDLEDATRRWAKGGREPDLVRRDFLDLAELDFIERGLEERLWGEELKRYLRGDALRFWLYLRRTGEPLTDWEQLRQRFCEQFCNITLERMKVMIAKNVWRGDHHAYSARFADIVAQGVTVAPDMLVGYYLANLPGEILREITRGGTRRFADWRDAAAALAAMATPWKDLCENHHRFRRDLEDATRRWAKGGREPDLV
ncbi:hypothetical protein ENH_00045930, partial [Eimeria necatrix]